MWVIDEGRYLGEHQTWNRAAQFADGLFETLVVRDGEYLALAQHVSRMRHGCDILNLQLPEQGLLSVFEEYKKVLLDQAGLSNGTLKIMARRADSARGYSYDNNQIVFTAFLSQGSSLSAGFYDKGVSLQYCQTQCSIQAQLAGLKHLNRLENVLAKNELQAGIFEGLMSNAFDYVVEGTMSNVFFEKNGKLITPDLDVSGVKGVMRALIIKYCEKHDINVQQCNIKKESIADFNSMFVCNSLVGVLPVQQVEKKLFTIGPITTDLLKAWRGGELYE